MQKTYLEEFKIGEKWMTPARTVTESDVMTYAGLTGDWHPIHTDKVYAEKTPLGERIVHGMLTLCLGSTLAFRLGESGPTPKAFIAFYGLESVRFLHPVKIGDTIHAEIEVSSAEMKDEKRGVLETKTAIINQRGETVVVSVQKALVGRRPS